MYRNALLPFNTHGSFVEPLVGRLFSNGADIPIRHGVDVEEQDDRATISLPLPGVRPDQLDISAEGRSLVVSVNQGEGSSFRRRYTVGPKYDLSKVEARLDLGILSLVLPKAPEAQPRQIPITVG